MTKLDRRWMQHREWIEVKDNEVVLKEDAPEELKESYKIYCEQLEKVRQREKALGAKIL